MIKPGLGIFCSVVGSSVLFGPRLIGNNNFWDKNIISVYISKSSCRNVK